MDGTRTIPVIRSIQAQRQAQATSLLPFQVVRGRLINGHGYTIQKTSGSGGFAYIESNTANTINFGPGFNSNLSFTAGDTFKINKVNQSIDQPGVGQSTLLSGDNPTPPPNWTQVVEPCYIWNNTTDGQPFNTFSAETSNIKQGVNYFDNMAMPGYTEYAYPHPLVTAAATATGSPDSATSTTRCSLLQERLDRLQRRQQRLQQRHRQNPRLNRRIRRLQAQLQQCV